MLKLVLLVNAMSCAIFGAIFFFKSPTVNQYLGIKDADWLVPSAGIILLIFCAHLLSAVVRKKILKGEIYYFSFGDGVWVLFTLLIISMTDVIETENGQLSATLVAMMVGFFGTIQYVIARRLPHDQIQVAMRSQASSSEAWAVLKNFSGIGRHHPMIKESCSVGSKEAGIGSIRVCEFHDSTKTEEIVTDWQEGIGYTVSVKGLKLPLSSLENTVLVSDGLVKLSSRFAGRGFFSEMIIGFFMRPLLIFRLKEIAKGFEHSFTVDQPGNKKMKARL